MKNNKINQNYLVIEYIINMGCNAEMESGTYQWHKKNFRAQTMYELGATYRYIDARIDTLEEKLENVQKSYIIDSEIDWDLIYPYFFIVETNEYDCGKKGDKEIDKIDDLRIDYDDMIYLINKEIKKLKAQLKIINKEIENF